MLPAESSAQAFVPHRVSVETAGRCLPCMATRRPEAGGRGARYRGFTRGKLGRAPGRALQRRPQSAGLIAALIGACVVLLGHWLGAKP